MDRFDPFVKYSDIYGDVVNWEKDPMNKPQNQNKYFFSDGKTYYEQICKMLKLMSVFKDAFNQIYNNEDEISSAWENFVDNLSATAVYGEEADVELTWTDTSVNFAFTIPGGDDGVGISSITFNSDYTMTITLTDGQTYTSASLRGPTGEIGPTGPQGEKGEPGEGLNILDVYSTLQDLQTAHPTGSPGDGYQVGTAPNFTLYIWSASQNQWVPAGTLGSVAPSTVPPLMDGTASPGSSNLYSRGDHVHPKDTSKLDKSSTNGVYAVANGSQVMIPVSSSPSANAITSYDNNGDIHAQNLWVNADAEITGAIKGNDITAKGDISATGDIIGTNITGSGTITGDAISITNNTILNSSKLSGIGGSVNAYQILATVSANLPVLGIGADLSANTPSVKFMGTKWGNAGTMSNAIAEVHFTNSFKTDSTSYPESRIGLAPASANVLGGVKPGRGIAVDSNGILSNTFKPLASGTDLNNIKYNYQGYASSPLNGPPNYSSGMLNVITNESNTSVMQMLHYYDDDRLYVRYYREATGWHDWMSILHAPLQALWTNESPTSAFLPQTISLDLTGYKYVVIVFKQTTSSTFQDSIVATTFGYDFVAHSISSTGTALYKRGFTAKSTGIQFYTGRESSNEDNNIMIPRFIYGIK